MDTETPSPSSGELVRVLSPPPWTGKELAGAQGDGRLPHSRTHWPMSLLRSHLEKVCQDRFRGLKERGRHLGHLPTEGPGCSPCAVRGPPGLPFLVTVVNGTCRGRIQGRELSGPPADGALLCGTSLQHLGDVWVQETPCRS